MEILKDVIFSFHSCASKPFKFVFLRTLCIESDLRLLGVLIQGCPDTRVVFSIQCLFLEGSLQSRGVTDMFCCFCAGSACPITGLTCPPLCGQQFTGPLGICLLGSWLLNWSHWESPGDHMMWPQSPTMAQGSDREDQGQ